LVAALVSKRIPAFVITTLIGYQHVRISKEIECSSSILFLYLEVSIVHVLICYDTYSCLDAKTSALIVCSIKYLKTENIEHKP
jgi:hypothetical protein